MAVLFVERFPFILGRLIFLTDSYIVHYVLSLSQVDFPNKCVFQTLNIAFIIANSADPGEMQQTTRLPFRVLSIKMNYSPFSDRFN